MSPLRLYLRAIAAMTAKDLKAEWRSREMFSAMLVFGLLVIFIFNFALEMKPAERGALTAGILWVTLAFTGTLGLNRAFAAEKDRGSLDGLLLAPVDRSAIYLSKTLSSLVIMLATAAVLLPLYSLFYNQNLLLPGILLVILLGCSGYVLIGALLASMAVQARTRDILLPILLFPVAIPLLVAAVKATGAFLAGVNLIEIQPWLLLLAAYDFIFLAVAFMAFDYIVEE